MRQYLPLSLYLVVLVTGCSKRQEPQPKPATFDVVITGVGQHKIPAIKGVREVTGLGLKDAKDLVEGVPATVKEDLPLGEAEAMAGKLRESDLTIEVRSH